MNKLLIITNASGGLYLFRQELISALIRSFEIYVITADTGRLTDLCSLGCEVCTVKMDRRGMNPIKDASFFIQLYKSVKRINPDYIITYTIKPNIYGGLIASLLKIPYASNITGLGTGFQTKSGMIKKMIVGLYRGALKRANVVFCENSSIRDEFLTYRISSQDRIVVLNGAGVNLDRFSYIDYPRDEVLFNFLFVARVMKEKGIDELLESVKRLNDIGLNCKLTIVGGCEEDYLDTLNSDTHVDYMGYQQDVRPFIKKAHCFVLPSYHEGMANTNLESAASGRPVITTNIPGCREAVIDGVSGFLCEPQNTVSLYEAMKKMMELSEEERIDMGLEGRKHMECVFDKRIVVNDTIECILNSN